MAAIRNIPLKIVFLNRGMTKHMKRRSRHQQRGGQAILGTTPYTGYSDKAISARKEIYTKTLPIVDQCGSYPIYEEPSPGREGGTILLMNGIAQSVGGHVISQGETNTWVGMQLYNANDTFLGNIVGTFVSEYCHASYPVIRTQLDSLKGPLNSPFTIRNYNTNTYPGYSSQAIKATSVGGYRRRKNRKTRRRNYKIEDKTHKSRKK